LFESSVQALTGSDASDGANDAPERCGSCREIDQLALERVMTAHLELVDRYFAAWNETDAARRRELIADTWAEDASYVDPLLAGKGHDGIDAMIVAVHERFPQHQFRLSAGADGFGNYVRFSWDLVAPGGEAIVKGSDYGVVDAAGRFASVTGFLDAVPQGV
jgi:hypothetical protein